MEKSRSIGRVERTFTVDPDTGLIAMDNPSVASRVFNLAIKASRLITSQPETIDTYQIFEPLEGFTYLHAGSEPTPGAHITSEEDDRILTTGT